MSYFEDHPWEDLGMEPEPEPEPEQWKAPATSPVRVEILPAAEPTVFRPVIDVPALTRALPDDFPLAKLLQFLPDVRLKQRADAAAQAALAVKVEGRAGLQAAEDALTPVRENLKAIEQSFEFPCDTAFQLHRRLTGLRADFSIAGKEAIDTVAQRILTEKRRLDAEDAADKRRRQDEADRAARAEAARAAASAARSQASPTVVQDLERRAMTATAPPVSDGGGGGGGLRKSSVVARWKARFKGTPADSSIPQPAVNELTPEQIIQWRAVCLSIAQGKTPVAVADINWSYINSLAVSEKTTLNIPEMEVYDEGGLRAKPAARRR